MLENRIKPIKRFIWTDEEKDQEPVDQDADDEEGTITQDLLADRLT